MGIERNIQTIPPQGTWYIDENFLQLIYGVEDIQARLESAPHNKYPAILKAYLEWHGTMVGHYEISPFRLELYNLLDGSFDPEDIRQRVKTLVEKTSLFVMKMVDRDEKIADNFRS